jgi:hypothetical protein
VASAPRVSRDVGGGGRESREILAHRQPRCVATHVYIVEDRLVVDVAKLPRMRARTARRDASVLPRSLTSCRKRFVAGVARV